MKLFDLQCDGRNPFLKKYFARYAMPIDLYLCGIVRDGIVFIDDAQRLNQTGDYLIVA